MSANRDKRIYPFPRGDRLLIDFEGQPITAFAGEPLAVSLFASGIQVLSRSIKFHRPRGFFCLTGNCGACLMRIDGVPNMKACRQRVHTDLRCERQNAWPSAGTDLLATADILFPQGMDHHTMMTEPRPLNALMQQVVRRLGGLGHLPDAQVTPRYEDLPGSRQRHLTVIVIGGGPAGLAAARVIATEAPAAKVLLVEGDPAPGGSYFSHPHFGPQAAAQAEQEVRAAGVEVLTSADVIGWYPEDLGEVDGQKRQGVLAVATNEGIYKLSAQRYLYATGAYEQNALFVDNDRPGVIAARAVGQLLTSYGVLPGLRPVVLGDTPYAHALAAALAEAGADVILVDGARERVTRAHGSTWITAVDVDNDRGVSRRIACDLLAVATVPAPASDLPRQHGAAVELSSGFRVVCAADGRTQDPAVFACGDVTGFVGVAEAREHGQQVGSALARDLLHFTHGDFTPAGL